MKLFGWTSNAKRIDKKPGASRASKGGGFWRAWPRWVRNLAITLLVIGLTAGILALVLRLYVRMPPPDTNISPPIEQYPSLSPDPNTSPVPTPSGLPVLSPSPEKKLTVRSGVYSFVLAGQRDGMTDTIMVALFDMNAGTLNVISIPRDTIIDTTLKIPKINSVYGSSGSQNGMDNLRAELRDIIGFVPANYALVGMNGFKLLVDKLGGVSFNVPIDMYLPEEGINLKAGQQQLNGDKALQLMRFRGYEGASAQKAGVDHNDFGRMQMQQRFLSALAKKMISWESIPKIGDIAAIFAQYVASNLDVGQMAGVGEQLLKLGSDDIHFYTLPSNSIYYTGGDRPREYYEVVDSQAALELINRTINPYTEDITPDMVKHIQLVNP